MSRHLYLTMIKLEVNSSNSNLAPYAPSEVGSGLLGSPRKGRGRLPPFAVCLVLFLGAISALAPIRVFADYSVSVNPASPNNSDTFGYASNNSAQVGQSFSTSAAGTLQTFHVYLTKNGSPSDSVQFDLYSESGGLPSGSSLVTQTYAGSSISSGGCALYDVTFPSPVSLSAATTYYLTFQRTGSFDTTNFYSACGTYPSPPLPDAVYASGSWSSGVVGINAVFDIVTSSTPTPPPVEPGVLAAQLTATNKVKIWATGSGSGVENQNTGFVQLGTPLTQDATTTGVQFYYQQDSDGSNISLNIGLYYADTSSAICVDPVNYTTFSLGSTTEHVADNQQHLVSIQCSPHFIDHTRPLMIHIWAGSDAHQSNVYTYGNTSQMYYQITGDGGYYTGASVNATRVISLTPDSGTVISTTTTLGLNATGYVSSDTDITGLVARFEIVNNGLASQNLTQPAFAQDEVATVNYFQDVPITSRGFFNLYATTSATVVGVYHYQVSIVRPRFSFLNSVGLDFGTDVLATKSVDFTVSTTTAIDKWVQAMDQTKINAFQPGVVANCNPLTFSAEGCVLFMFNPDPSTVQKIQSQTGQLLQKFPWGYATRAIGLLSGALPSNDGSVSGGLPSDLPTLAINVSDSHLPGTSGLNTLDLTPWNEMLGNGSILSTATSTKDGLTLRQITEPGWDFLIVFLFGLLMFSKILGLDVGHSIEVQSYNQYRRTRNNP